MKVLLDLLRSGHLSTNLANNDDCLISDGRDMLTTVINKDILMRVLLAV